MQADLFKCPFCSESFDLELRIPKTLIPCQHCICLKCLNLIFSLYSPSRRKCPICHLSLPPKIKFPNAFPNDQTLFHLLESRQHLHSNVKERSEWEELSPNQAQAQEQQNIDSPGVNQKRALDADELDEAFQDKVRKKIKTEQEIDDELAKLQELITNQFTEMRKMLHTGSHSQKKTSSKSTRAHIPHDDDDDSEFMIKEEYSDAHRNEHPLAEIANKLKGVFTETQEALNRLLQTGGPVKIEETQPSEQSFQQIPSEGEEIRIKMEEASSSLDLQPEIESEKEMEEELKEDQSQSQDEALHETEIQEEHKETEFQSQDEIIQETNSQLKLDFSEKDISETMFTNLYSHVDKTKISCLEVDFSASSLTDQQFIRFLQDIMVPMENLTSIVLNLAETRISSESLQAFSGQCLKNYKLKNLVLNCSGTSIGDEGLQSLDDGLGPSVQTLENIEIILNTTDIPGDKFLDVLFGMDQLKSLKLSFDNSLITLEILSSVLFCLSFLAQNLESLELNFNGIEIYDESLGSFCNVLLHMEKLKHFKLCLGGTYISNYFILDLFQNLSSLASHLETLELDLHYTELYNRAFKNFCDGALSEMKNIETLKLDLRGTKITDISLKNLVLPVSKLTSLSLNLSENKIHDSGLQIFKENNSFKNIKSIDLQVGETDVTDEALQDFLKHIEKSYEVNAPPLLRKESSSKESSEAKNHSDKEPINLKNGNKEFIPKELDPIIKVFSELKKELVSHYGLKSQPSKVETMRVSKLINNLEPKVYDEILVKILTNILAVAKVEVTVLEEWKKIIQAKIASSLANSKKLPSKNPRRRNTQAKHDNRDNGKEQNQTNAVVEQENQIIETEQDQSNINIETEQSPPKIETEQDDGNIKVELGDINIKTEHGYINIDNKQNPPNIKTEEEDIEIKAEQYIGDIETEENDGNTIMQPNVEINQNVWNFERAQNHFIAERQREIFNIVSRYMGRKPKNIEKKQPSQENVSFENEYNHTSSGDPEASQNNILSEVERKIWNVERNQSYTSVEKKQKIFDIVRKYSGGKKQKNSKKKESIQNSSTLESSQNNSSIEKSQSVFNTEKKHDIFGMQDNSIERMQGNSNAEANQYYLNTGREQYLFNTDAQPAQYPIGMGRSHPIFTIERTQNNHSKPKIFNVVRSQKKTASIAKKQKHTDENETMRNLQISEEVFSFKWMRRYVQEISFREKVIEILKSLENRSLPVLYKKLLEYIEELSPSYPNWRMPDKIRSPTYSYNWWSRFITGDAEIKNLWKGFTTSHDSIKKPSHQFSDNQIFYGF